MDDRGRIVIPKIVRESLKLMENSQLLMIADPETRTIKLTPSGSAIKNPVQYKITIEDSAGSLGKIATAFGKLGISLYYGEAMTIEKGKKAVWIVLGPEPQDRGLEEIEQYLKDNGEALAVEFKRLD